MEVGSALNRDDFADGVADILRDAGGGKLLDEVQSSRGLELHRKKLSLKKARAALADESKKVLAALRNDAAMFEALRQPIRGELLPHRKETVLNWLRRANCRIDSKYLQQKQQEAHQQQKQDARQPMTDITDLLQKTRSGLNNARDSSFASSMVDLKYSNNIPSYEGASKMVSEVARRVQEADRCNLSGEIGGWCHYHAQLSR